MPCRISSRLGLEFSATRADADTIGVLGLALNACEDRDGFSDERERIRELLTAARDLWRVVPEVEGEDERRQVRRATFRLIHLADIWAVTSGA